MAELIKLALCDKTLRNRIGVGGFNTLKEHFEPELVVSKLVNKIQTLSLIMLSLETDL